MGCWWFSGQHSFHNNSSSVPSRPEHLCSDPVGPSSTKHGLDEVWSSEVPVDMPGTKVPVTACLQRIQLTVALVRPTQPAIALCHMPSRASSSTSCPKAIGAGRGIIRTISENWENICNCWFQLATARRQIWGNVHLSYDLDLGDPTWYWSDSLAKVRSDSVREQSQVHFMSISTHWKHKKDPNRLYFPK